MGENREATKMASEYTIEPPVLTIPDSSPEWVSAMFPALIRSVYQGFNGVLQKVINDFNATFVEMQKQIDELSKLTQNATRAMEEFKIQLLEKDYIMDDQTQKINQLRGILDKNETYSRRPNLIFGGISFNNQGSCTSIVHNIMKTKLNIEDPTIFKFVRCHYLKRPTNISKGSIIARFEYFDQRMDIWSKRRSLLSSEFYLTEDFPAEVNRKRNKLRPILKEASKHQQYERCISMKYDKLNFDGTLYGIDDLHKLPVSIHPRTLSERRTKGILCFGGVLSEYHELSNYYKCEFVYKEVRFTSVEQGYQFCKATLFGDDRTAHMILCTNCPSEIKLLGRAVSGFDATKWSEGREKLMKRLLHEKFAQNPVLKKMLCDTGTMHLAEATRSDTYFGTGVPITNPTCTQRSTWTGTNVLGQLLMDTRRELKRSV